MSDIIAGNKNLLELADILDAAHAARALHPEIAPYCQGRFAWDCGTPACALGHWAAAHPEGWRWYGDNSRWLEADGLDGATITAFARAAEVFALTIHRWDRTDYYDDPNDSELVEGQPEVAELFDEFGCGNAGTAAEAAAYIRKFVARRTP